MTKVWFSIALSLANLGCSSERKVSHVETRVPASMGAHASNQLLALRASISRQTTFPAACPAEVRELVSLAEDRVVFPPCPDSLSVALQAARASLNLEESSAVEEMISAQCRRNLHEGVSDSIMALLQEPDHKNTNPAISVRESLRATLLNVQNLSEPLHQWIRNNGEMALPEEQLFFLDRMVNHDGCRMPDQEIDASYRLLRNLDELVRIQGEGQSQRKRLERLLSGVHKVMDRKIQEYFRR